LVSSLLLGRSIYPRGSGSAVGPLVSGARMTIWNQTAR